MTWFKRKSDDRQQAPRHDLAEMEDRNRAITKKVDQLARLLDELNERKRGDNHP